MSEDPVANPEEGSQKGDTASSEQGSWKYLSPSNVDEYHRISGQEGSEAAGSFLSQSLDLPEYTVDMRSAAKIDFAAYMMDFCSTQKFSPTQSAAVLEVALGLLEKCAGGASLADTQDAMKSSLVQLVQPRPKYQSPKLSPEQVTRIGLFMTQTFLRHYRLYAYLYMYPQDVTNYSNDVLVETMVPNTFDEAITEQEYLDSVEERRAKAEAEAKAAAEAAGASAAEAERLRIQKEKEEAEARRQSELTMKPANLEEAIKQMVAVKLEAEKAVLEEEYKAKEAALIKEINQLQGIPDPEEDAAAAAAKKGSGRASAKKGK